MPDDIENTETDTGNEETELELSEAQLAMFDKLVKARSEENLSKMKTNMDRMSEERDQAIREKARFEEAETVRKQEQLEKDGKIQESLEMQLTALKEKNKLLNDRISTESRSRNLSSALRSVDFRNDRAAELAEMAIVPQLIQDKDGNWVHKSGISISEFVKTYFSDEDNEYLLKPKQSRGTGDVPNPGTKSDKAPASLSGVSSSKMLELVRAGKVGRGVK
jgi:hypothetical protein